MAIKSKQLSTLSPLQEQLMKLISDGLLKGAGPLKDIFGAFNEQEFQKGVAEPELKRFREDILPQLREQYISQGTAFGSSRLRGENRAARDFESDLSRLRYQGQQDQLNRRTQGVQGLFGRQAVENIVQPKNKSSFWSDILPVIGTVGGAFAGNPALGNIIGSGAKKAVEAVSG